MRGTVQQGAVRGSGTRTFLTAGETAKEHEITDKTDEEMPEFEGVLKAFQRVSNKDSNAYKVIKQYYDELISGNLDEGGRAFVRGKILNIEKYLRKWIKEHPNSGATMMQPEESALILIDDLRKSGLLE
jgi:hypothetical protein